jgi:predicted dinucleotide-binding enzyme
MKFGVLGSGAVGHAIGNKLIQLGHEVCMGSRESSNEKGLAFARANTPKSTNGTFADAAEVGEVLFNCTSGKASLDALAIAGEKNLAGKVLVDVANPLDFSKGMPPSMLTPSTDSLAEQIQRAHPKCKVVKALNTMNCALMVDPKRLSSGNHDVLMCGNDKGAKGQVSELLQSFGWKSIIDLGDLTAARGLEMFLPLWVRLYSTFQTPDFNIKVVR